MDKTIKVLRILHRPSISGPTFHAAYLTSGLSGNFRTKLIVGVPEKEEVDGSYIFDDLGIKSHTIKNMKRSINPFQDVLALIEIIKIIREYKPQIVHTHAAKSGTLGRIAAIICRVPVVVHTFHGNVFSGYFNKVVTNVFLNIERFLAKRSSKIIAISNLQKTEICEHYKICDATKATVIPLGLALNRFSQKDHQFENYRQHWHIENDSLAIGIIGRVTKIKNHKLFVDAFCNVKKSCQIKLKGVIVGEGDLLQEIKDYCTSKSLVWKDITNIDNGDYDILFTHNQKDIPAVIHGMDIIALSSDNEGTPVTLFEAQAAGKPIVSTNVGGIADMVENEVSTLLSVSGDEEAFSKNLLLMIEKLDDYTAQAEKRADVVIDQFSTKNLVHNISELYKDLLKAKGL